MFTLIMREIEDNWVFLLAAALLACVFSFLIGWQMYYVNGSDEGSSLLVLIANAVGGMFIFCGLGAAQMYWDRIKRTSALLATLPVTRNQIFTARIATGGLAVVMGFLPTVGTMIVVSGMVESSSVAGVGPVIWVLIFIFCLASYCVGLQTGWTSNRIMPTLGSLLLSFILTGVIWIKGFELDAYLILIPFIACCLFRAWRTFSTAAL
ncbi:MAG: hypothetical protein ABSB11_09895 [Sedimentisphaerales bacterium]